MSLSRILNDDPLPLHNSRIPKTPLSTNPSPEPSFDNDHPRHQQDHLLPSSSRYRSSALYPPDDSTSPRTFHPQPGTFQPSTRDWDSYSGEWPHEQGPASHGNSLYHDQQPSRYMSPDPPRPSVPARDPEPETLSRKRRKNTNDDSSYTSAAPRRVSRLVSTLGPPSAYSFSFSRVLRAKAPSVQSRCELHLVPIQTQTTMTYNLNLLTRTAASSLLTSRTVRIFGSPS